MQSVRLQDRVAEEVRALLARRRLSAAKASQQLGWSAQYLSHRMTGRTVFDVADLEALAGLLEVPVTAFFAGSDAGREARMTNNACYSTPSVPLRRNDLLDSLALAA